MATPATEQRMHIGTTRITASGSDQLSYCPASTRNTSTTAPPNTNTWCCRRDRDSGLIVWNPVAVGQWFGPAAIAFLAFGHIVPVGSAAVIMATEARIPIITLVFAVAFLLSGFFNNHVVPVIPGTGPSVADARRFPCRLRLAQDSKPESDPNRPIPIVFVSTAGGGLRAAYWTSTVLGSLRDACDAFVPHLFSISGVSGGSVGTAFFVASTKSGMTAPSSAACSPDVPKPDNRTNTAEQLMLRAESADFLGPTVAALLYPDFVYRLAPLPFLKDRGQALADAWSEFPGGRFARRAIARKHDGDFFDQPFLVSSAESSTAWSPVLFFNGTHQETGKRIIASNVQVTDSVFSDALDLQGVIRGDVTLKTAVLNSARFTYVSPAGELVRDPNGAKIDEGHVLDGGYFENYGAVTSKQAAEAALRRAGRRRRRGHADLYPDLERSRPFERRRSVGQDLHGVAGHGRCGPGDEGPDQALGPGTPLGQRTARPDPRPDGHAGGPRGSWP